MYIHIYGERNPNRRGWFEDMEFPRLLKKYPVEILEK